MKMEVRIMMRLVRSLVVVALETGEWRRLLDEAIEGGLECNVPACALRLPWVRKSATEQAIAYIWHKDDVNYKALAEELANDMLREQGLE